MPASFTSALLSASFMSDFCILFIYPVATYPSFSFRYLASIMFYPHSWYFDMCSSYFNPPRCVSYSFTTLCFQEFWPLLRSSLLSLWITSSSLYFIVPELTDLRPLSLNSPCFYFSVIWLSGCSSHWDWAETNTSSVNFVRSWFFSAPTMLSSWFHPK